MEVVFSILTLIGMGYAAYCGLKWMMRSGIVNARKEQPLTPNDLKVLENSAARLLADLRSVTDECVARIDRACSEAEIRLNAFEKLPISRQYAAGREYVSPSIIRESVSTSEPELYEMIELDELPAGVAAYSGMSKGEIELMQGLKSIGN